ncbi:hypothetical protein [Streptomyces sp. 11x1]|uniref:hypothetical protein n=1 Tax=Streptomyces sp. 11x1 TaxID=3038642 RepID=UPI0029316B9C|nr:hypothetical protein [Streptomyces sp. 11x1]WNZ08398.1 hypothetical protein P8T65_12875 [Streptomyces sp. 11x1]
MSRIRVVTSSGEARIGVERHLRIDTGVAALATSPLRVGTKRPVLMTFDHVISHGERGILSMCKKTSLSVALTGLVAGLFVTLPASDANAATWTTHTKKYSQTKSFYSKPLKRCVRTTLSGKVTFKYGYIVGRHTYKDIKVIEPKMATKVLTKCSGGKAATTTKMEMTQRWYESRKCEMEVGVSAGAPWSISVTPTVECGSRKAGTRKSVYGNKNKTYTQSNTGRPLYFKGKLEIRHSPTAKYDRRFCMSGRPTVQAYVKNNSDAWSQTMKFCFKR